MSHRRRDPLIFACANFPWPLHQGVKLRLFHIIRTLQEEFDVHLIVLTDDGPDLLEESGLRDSCASTQLVPLASAHFRQSGTFPIWHPQIVSRLRQLFRDPLPSTVRGYHSNDFVGALRALRAIHGDVPVWADTAPCAEMAREAGYGRILVDYDDIESQQADRGLKLLPWRPGRAIATLDVLKTKKYERSMPARFEAIVIARQDDMGSFGPDRSRLHVVPNGVVETAEIGPAGDGNRILFVGSFSWHPNSEAVEWMAAHVMPLIRNHRPDVSFVAVGQRGEDGWADRMRQHGVEVHESVASLLPFYQDATIVVAPLHRGSGTKLKVLEAMMLGRPIVATAVAMEGIEAQDNDAVLVAEAPQAFADAVIRLLSDPALQTRLASRARQIVMQRYSLESITPLIHAAARRVAKPAMAEAVPS